MFHPYNLRKDGTFGSSQKKNSNFRFSYIIGVDIDRTEYDSPQQYIEKLRLKPTFWYTSYSHKKHDEKKNYAGPRFRLIYFFTSYMDNPYHFRYCASKLNNMIEEDTDERIVDDCNLRCTQYFNGTCVDNHDLNVEHGLTNLIYDLKDIGVNMIKSSDSDYIEFLCDTCNYKSLNPEQILDIRNEIKRITHNEYFYNGSEKRFEVLDLNPVNYTHSTTINVGLEKDRTTDFEYTFDEICLKSTPETSYSYSTRTILYDWDNRATTDFMKCSQWNEALKNTKFVYRYEKDWMDRNYQLVDDDYFAMFHFRNRRLDGEGRRKTLFQRMCLRRIMYPAITKDEMVVNTIIDILMYFDHTSDNVLNSDFITSNIETAFSMTHDKIKVMYKDSIEYLKSKTRPKRGYIIKSGVDVKQVTCEILDEYYDTCVSVTENHNLINSSTPFSFSLTSLYDYCHTRNIKTDKTKLSDDEIIDLIDVSLSYRKTYKWFNDNGFKVGDKRLRRLYNLKKENEGETGSAEYVVKHDFEPQPHSTTINVGLEKDRTLTSTANNWMFRGHDYREDVQWDERFKDEWERYGGMNMDDVMDDIVGWCNDFLG